MKSGTQGFSIWTTLFFFFTPDWLWLIGRKDFWLGVLNQPNWQQNKIWYNDKCIHSASLFLPSFQNTFSLAQIDMCNKSQGPKKRFISCASLELLGNDGSSWANKTKRNCCGQKILPVLISNLHFNMWFLFFQQGGLHLRRETLLTGQPCVWTPNSLLKAAFQW